MENILFHKVFTKKSGLIKYCWLLNIMICVFTPWACEDFVEVGAPNNETPSITVFADDETALAAILGLYITLSESTGFITGANSLVHVSGLSSDELLNNSSLPTLAEFYANELSSVNVTNTALWRDCYAAIFQVNAIIEGVALSTGMTESSKRQLEGEARFIRSYFHFYLLNLYGEVPLVTSTNYQVNNTASRTPVSGLYQQIKEDLVASKNLMITDYAMEGGQRIRPNKWAATALLARVYLYEQDWMNAEAQATEVISQSSQYRLVPLNQVFLKNNQEAIWQLMPSQAYNTFDGGLFIINSSSVSVELPDGFLTAFEEEDNRYAEWVGRYVGGGDTLYFPYKYKYEASVAPTSEYLVVLRLAEQFLIRAEARVRQGSNLVGARNDVNAIRARAGLEAISATTINALLDAIMQERRMELFTEGGHRWLDLKRWGRATEVLSPLKTGWVSEDVLYPIPQTELLTNPNLLPQNQGY